MVLPRLTLVSKIVKRQLTTVEWRVITISLEIDNFFVLPQRVYSDRAEVVVSIKNVGYPKIDPEGDQEEWYLLGKRKILDSKSLSFLRENLENTSDVQLDTINSLIQSKNNHEAARTLIKIIENAASFSIKEQQKGHNIQQFPHKRRRKKQKAWFDKDLQDLKKKNK